MNSWLIVHGQKPWLRKRWQYFLLTLNSASDLATSFFLTSEVHSQKYILGDFQPTWQKEIVWQAALHFA